MKAAGIKIESLPIRSSRRHKLRATDAKGRVFIIAEAHRSTAVIALAEVIGVKLKVLQIFRSEK